MKNLRPPGPFPTTDAISTPISCAIFLASGDATARSSEEDEGAVVAATLGTAFGTSN